MGGATWKQVHCVTRENSDINERLDALHNSEFADLKASGLKNSAEDKTALDKVSASAIHKQGQYEIALPLKVPALLPNNYQLAYQRLQCLRRRLTKNPVLFAVYQENVVNCISKGYIEFVPVHQQNH